MRGEKSSGGSEAFKSVAGVQREVEIKHRAKSTLRSLELSIMIASRIGGGISNVWMKIRIESQPFL